jgi:polysaccharide deacetylase 2 family uncharacterized protein YibQ
MAKRKPSTKTTRRTSRRVSRGKRNPSKLKLYLLGGSVAGLILAVLLGLAGWIGYEMGRERTLAQCEKKVENYRADIEHLRKRLSSSRKSPPSSKRVSAPGQKREGKPAVPSEARDYKSAGGAETAKLPEKEKLAGEKPGAKPRLVIIIDDVAFPSQLKKIKSLPWHVTPSLFPPSSRHPETSRMAAKLDHYMIHLPMEAVRFNSPEEETLTTESSAAEIDLRIRKLRHWFPNARFINNHTGSKFTADMTSMERFFPIARRYGFVFVDSRTTPDTVVPKLCKRFGEPYVARDIFLDNEEDVAYIQKQLKKAVRLARAHGYAIAIGHPHRTTLEALAASGAILKGVDVVYIDELYEAITR